MATKVEKEKEQPAATGIAVAPPSVLSRVSAIPDYLREGGQEGMEEMEASDVSLPRLGLCQDGTPARKKDHADYIPGLEEGMFFNTVSRKIYGVTVRIIPVRFFKQRIKFFPMDDGGGIECQSLNSVDGGRLSPLCRDCKYSQFIDGEPPACTEFHNRVSMVVPDGDSLVVSLKSTSIPMSRQWSAFSKIRNAPLYSALYELRSVSMTKGGKTFYGYHQHLVQNVSPEDFKTARAFFQDISSKTISVDLKDESAGEGGMGEEGFNTSGM